MEKIKRFIENVRQYLDFYVTVILAFVIATMGIAGIADQAIISSAILATLGLISYSLIRNRRQDEEIRSKLLEISVTERLSEKFFTQDFRVRDLKEQISQAKEIIFWGLTFTKTVEDLTSPILQALKKEEEYKLRFLLIEHDSTATEMAAFRNNLRRQKSKVNELVERTLTRLAEINDATSNSKGKLEVRVVNYLPPWTMIAINPNTFDGFMSIRLTTFGIPNDERPHFELNHREDEYWFKFFLSQFESVWAEGEKVELDRYLHILAE